MKLSENKEDKNQYLGSIFLITKDNLPINSNVISRLMSINL